MFLRANNFFGVQKAEIYTTTQPTVQPTVANYLAFTSLSGFTETPLKTAGK